VLPARPHPPHCIGGIVKIGAANFEELQLGINSSELVAEEARHLMLGQRFVNSRGDFLIDFSCG